MAERTYAIEALVLRKTKLKESDLILTLVDGSGAQRRVVAKGARKPSSVFSSRLELFSRVEALCAQGRSLDIVKEVRLVDAHAPLRGSLERATAAAPMAELLGKVTQESLEDARLFQATEAAFGSLERVAIPGAPAMTAAHLLKTLAFSGLRPVLGSCVSCGVQLPEGEGQALVSFREGGTVCPRCRAAAAAVPVEASSIEVARRLLGTTFAELEAAVPPLGASFGALRLAQGLIREHVGGRLKALEFMLSCGLYEDAVY